MGRLVIVIGLVAGLITLAVLEQHFIQGAYNYLERNTNEIMASVRSLDEEVGVGIATPENIAKINYMYEWWLKQERRLSMLARHFDLAQVSDSLIYAKNFIYFNNKEEAMVGLLKLQYLIKTHSFNIGTSIQNVI